MATRSLHVLVTALVGTLPTGMQYLVSFSGNVKVLNIVQPIYQTVFH